MSETNSVSIRTADGKVIVDGGRWDPYDPVSRRAEAERMAHDPKRLRSQIEFALELLAEGKVGDAVANLRAALTPRLPSVKDLEWAAAAFENLPEHLKPKGNHHASLTDQGLTGESGPEGNRSDEPRPATLEPTTNSNLGQSRAGSPATPTPTDAPEDGGTG